MKVSIITPIYKVEQYIAECAESLFCQTYENIEFIFVNDCTPDNSIRVLEEVLNKYPQVVKKTIIISHIENKGLACARNTGVRAATGDFVMHVDSDDSIESNTVELCVKKAIETKSDAVIFGIRHIKKSGDVIEHVSIPIKHTDYIKQLIIRDALVCMCSGLYKRSLYIDNNVWAFPGLNMGEDYSTKPRLLYFAKNVVAIDLPLYRYNHLNENSYTNKFTKSSIENLKTSIDILTSFFLNRTDGKEYIDDLKRASLISKIILLKSWAISQSTSDDFDMIRELYKDIDIKYINSPIDKLLLVLSSRNQKKIIKIIVNIGIKIKSIF